MPGQFEPITGGGAAVALDEIEISIIRSLTVQLLELIGPGPGGEEGERDPLAELFTEGPSEPPSDPVLRRLFPDAYTDPDRYADPGTYADPGRPGDGGDEARQRRELSAEFRRFTENDLRTRKRDDALAVVRSLDELTPAGDRGAVLRLAPETARQWLGTLNDVRLALGARLDVKDDDGADEMYRLPDSDPRKPMVMAYLWLGALQESLVGALLP